MACLPERCGAELDREPRLFMALPGSDTLCRPAKILPPKTHQPPPPSSSSSSTSSLPALGSICCAGTAFVFFFFVVFRHLVRGPHRRQMSPNCPPPFLEKKKTQETTAKDNPRLKTNLKLKIVYFSPPKVYKYFSITCRHFRLTLIPR